MAELRDSWTAEDLSRGEIVIHGWQADQRVNSYADSFRGLLAMQANADTLYPPSFLSDVLSGVTLGGAHEEALADYKNGAREGVAYLANCRAMRMLYNQSRRVESGATLDLPTVPAGLPIIVAGAVVGVAAVAGLTWWGVDRNERQAEVSKVAAVAAAEAQMYVARVKAAVETKTAIPDPPDLVGKLASAEASSGIWLVGSGVGIGLVAAGAFWLGTKRTPPQRRANPTRIARRRTRREPVKVQRTRRPAAGSSGSFRDKPRPRTRPAKRSNPARRKPSARMTPKRKQVMAIAYSAWQTNARSSVGTSAERSASFINASERRTVEDLAKIGWLTITERGKWRGKTEVFAKITPKGRAALGESWGMKLNPTKKAATKRRANPLRAGYSRAAVAANVAELKRKGYPERQAVAAAMRSARAAWRKKSPRGGYPAHLQTASERKGRKRAAKKTTRKKNPTRAKVSRKQAPPKGDSARAKWVRGQMRKGRSKKQAEALWKGQQAMKKKRAKRSPKARAGARRRR